MSLTADRYAQALFNVVEEQDNLDDVQMALDTIRHLLRNKKDFQQFISNPLFTFEERSNILKALFEGKVPDIVYRFLLFVTFKQRLNILKEIIESFDDFYLSGTHQMRAYIKTAFPLKDEDKMSITHHLNDKYRRSMLILWTLDSSLLGGFRIYVQGRIYDYSFRSQLNHFYQQTTQLV